MGRRKDPNIASDIRECPVHGRAEFRLYTSCASAAPQARCLTCLREKNRQRYQERGREPESHYGQNPEPSYTICQKCFLARPCECDE